MNRRAFLKNSGAAALGLAAIPFASALRLWSGTAHTHSGEDEMEPEINRLTEEEVIELTLNYADSYADVLPGVNIRESLLTRLMQNKRGS